MGFEMKGFDEVKKNLDRLAKNPEQFLEGHTAEIQHEEACKSCGEKFQFTIPVRIEKVVGNKGYGPGYLTKQECPACGELNKYQFGKAVFDIRTKS